MANEQNLRPGEYKLSKEEAKKGGQHSAESRRKKAEVKKVINDILSLNMRKGKKYDAEVAKCLGDLNKKNTDVLTMLLLKVLSKASKGDLQALKMLLDYGGHSPFAQQQNEEAEAAVKEFEALDNFLIRQKEQVEELNKNNDTNPGNDTKD